MKLIGPGSENVYDALLGSRDAYAFAIGYLNNIQPGS
jgi:hypothetical protein